MQVHVILWSYHDKSGFGAVRAYFDKERAGRDLQMLRDHGDKDFTLATFDVDTTAPMSSPANG